MKLKYFTQTDKKITGHSLLENLNYLSISTPFNNPF